MATLTWQHPLTAPLLLCRTHGTPWFRVPGDPVLAQAMRRPQTVTLAWCTPAVPHPTHAEEVTIWDRGVLAAHLARTLSDWAAGGDAPWWLEALPPLGETAAPAGAAGPVVLEGEGMPRRLVVVPTLAIPIWQVLRQVATLLPGEGPIEWDAACTAEATEILLAWGETFQLLAEARARQVTAATLTGWARGVSQEIAILATPGLAEALRTLDALRRTEDGWSWGSLLAPGTPPDRASALLAGTLAPAGLRRAQARSQALRLDTVLRGLTGEAAAWAARHEATLAVLARTQGPEDTPFALEMT